MQSESVISDRFESSSDETDTDVILDSAPQSPCRVLLVDDDEVVRYQLTALLKPAGYEVHSVSSGNEALRLLESTFCQIVLTGWHMPDMDGIALCRHLRRLQG